MNGIPQLSRSLLVLTTTLLLAACGGSDSDDGDDAAVAVDKLAGQYAGVYQDDGAPRLATVTVIDSDDLTLVVLDEQDRRSEYSGRYAAKTGTFEFAGGGSCQAADEALQCTLDGQSVTLAASTAESLDYSVADLAGRYQVRLDGELYTLTAVSDGDFTVSVNGCDTAGNLSLALDGTLVAVRLTSAECGGTLVNGYLSTDSLYASHDVLVTYLPGSELSGYWIR